MSILICLFTASLIIQSPGLTSNIKPEHTYKKIISEYNNEHYVRDFDLDRPDVSAYMIAQMNASSDTGGSTSRSVLRGLIKDAPTKTVEWLLDSYGQFSPMGRMVMADGLRHVDCRETYRLLFMLLEDRTTVKDDRARAMSGPLFQEMRVCDEAYTSITYMLYLHKQLPAGVAMLISPTQPLGERDVAIRHLKQWWMNESALVLSQKPALSTTRPSIQNKVESLLHSR